MRRAVTLLAVVLATTAIALDGIACSSDDNESNVSDTPTAISQETPLATEPSTTEATDEATSANTTPAEGTAVDVNLTEYIVSPRPASVPAGPVTFTAKNIGGTEHELVVIKTELPPDGLPTNADGSADETGAGVEVIDKIEEFPSEEERTVTANLDAGAYVLICNVVQESSDGATTSHYDQGMTSAFTVE